MAAVSKDRASARLEVPALVGNRLVGTSFVTATGSRSLSCRAPKSLAVRPGANLRWAETLLWNAPLQGEARNLACMSRIPAKPDVALLAEATAIPTRSKAAFRRRSQTRHRRDAHVVGRHAHPTRRSGVRGGRLRARAECRLTSAAASGPSSVPRRWCVRVASPVPARRQGRSA